MGLSLFQQRRNDKKVLIGFQKKKSSNQEALWREATCIFWFKKL